MSDKYPDLYRHELHYPNGDVETFRARKRAWLDLRSGVNVHVDNQAGLMCFQSLDQCNRWLFLEPFATQGIAWVTVELPLHPNWIVRKDKYTYDLTKFVNDRNPINRHVVQLVNNIEEPVGYWIAKQGNPYDGKLTRNIPEQRANLRFTDRYSFYWAGSWMFGEGSGYRAYIPRQVIDYLPNTTVSDVEWDGHHFVGLTTDWNGPGGTPDYDDCNPFFTDALI